MRFVLINAIGGRRAGDVLDDQQGDAGIIVGLMKLGGALVQLPNGPIETASRRATAAYAAGAGDDIANGIMLAALATGGGGDSFKVAVTSSDPAPDYLAAKLVAGANVSFAVLPGELLRVDATTPVLQNTVYVAKNGIDASANGSVARPFLTVQAALEYAWSAYVQPVGPQPAPPFTRPVVLVMPGTYDDGPLVLPPHVCVQGCGGNHSRITGDWSIDGRWSNGPSGAAPSNDCRSMFLEVGIYGNVTIDFAAYDAGEGKFWAHGVRFAGGGTLTLQSKIANPVSNSAWFQACEHNGPVVLNAVPTTMVAPMFAADPGGNGPSLTLNQQGGSSDNFFTSWGGSLGPIIINAALGAPGYDVRLGHSSQPPPGGGYMLTLNGTSSAVYINANARPQPGAIQLLGGATLAQITDLNP